MKIDAMTENLLQKISDLKGRFDGAFSIRENGSCVAMQSTDHIQIIPKQDNPGIEIRVEANTKGETVFIPACVNHGGVQDLVYNDFYIGANADIIIEAGCGVHSNGEGEASHNGIHRFFLGAGAKVTYQEKHIGTGTGNGKKRIDPVTEAFLEEGSVLEMDTVQIGGVDESVRKTTATVGKDAKLLVRERIMTAGIEKAWSNFDVIMDGENSVVDLVSRSVAKGNSYQEFKSCIQGKAACTGHSECDAILVENGTVRAIPALEASNLDAALIHEAAIGKIAGEQVLKLQTLGLTEEEAQDRIIAGFLK